MIQSSKIKTIEQENRSQNHSIKLMRRYGEGSFTHPYPCIYKEVVSIFKPMTNPVINAQLRNILMQQDVHPIEIKQTFFYLDGKKIKEIYIKVFVPDNI